MPRPPNGSRNANPAKASPSTAAAEAAAPHAPPGACAHAEGDKVCSTLVMERAETSSATLRRAQQAKAAEVGLWIRWERRALGRLIRVCPRSGCFF